MANIKSQVKRAKTNEKQRLQNVAFKSSLKTALKNVEVAVKDNNKEVATTALNLANQKIDKAVTKGIFHKNKAARQKARVAKLVNSIA